MHVIHPQPHQSAENGIQGLEWRLTAKDDGARLASVITGVACSYLVQQALAPIPMRHRKEGCGDQRQCQGTRFYEKLSTVMTGGRY